MYTYAKVLETNKDKTVKLGCDTGACQGCKAELFCNNKGMTEYLARNDKNIELKAGDTVKIYLPPGKTIASTLLVFALPLALFPAGYLLLRNLTALSEVVCALGGFLAMAAAFAIAALINIRHKHALMPLIVEKGEN